MNARKTLTSLFTIALMVGLAGPVTAATKTLDVPDHTDVDFSISTTQCGISDTFQILGFVKSHVIQWDNDHFQGKLNSKLRFFDSNGVHVANVNTVFHSEGGPGALPLTAGLQHTVDCLDETQPDGSCHTTATINEHGELIVNHIVC